MDHALTAVTGGNPLDLVMVVAAITLGAFTHQGYRWGSGRGTVFGTRQRRGVTPTELAREENFQGELMVEKARTEHGLPPEGGPRPLAPYAGVAAANDGSGWGVADAGYGPRLPQPAPVPAPRPVAAPNPAPVLPPAGWFADPERPGRQRFWTGSTWAPSGVVPTGITAPVPPA